MRNEKRVNLAFSLLEFMAIKQVASAAGVRVGTYCRENIIKTVGKIKNEMPEPGIEQLNLFSRKKRGKRLTKKGGLK